MIRLKTSTWFGVLTGVKLKSQEQLEWLITKNSFSTVDSVSTSPNWIRESETVIYGYFEIPDIFIIKEPRSATWHEIDETNTEASFKITTK